MADDIWIMRVVCSLYAILMAALVGLMAGKGDLLGVMIFELLAVYGYVWVVLFCTVLKDRWSREAVRHD